MPGQLNIASTYSRKPYIEIVDDVLDLITRGIAKDKHLFRASKLEYDLAFRPFNDIADVEGTIGGEKRTFLKGSDYTIAEDRQVLVWIGTKRPDEGTEFKVSYSIKDQSSLTDANKGSVLRTIVEAVSKELDHVYEQMDGVYKSGFIDTATGNALDGVTALIGIRRKPPARSMGFVTFWRYSDPPDMVIKDETVLYDGRGTYPLKEGRVKTITAVKGIVKGNRYTFNRLSDFDVKDGNSVTWLTGGARPDESTTFSVDYAAFERVFVPLGTRLSTLSQASGIKLFETTEEATLKKLPNGSWEVDAQVRSLDYGHQSNVIAGAITRMPNPPIGVEHVVNRSNTRDGEGRETDERLRERAKYALERAGRATITSLRTALESIEGVQYPLIREYPDGVAGIVKVVIDGGIEEDIKRVIENTRAAGIFVELKRPVMVYLDFIVTVLPRMAKMPNPQKEQLKSLISTKIKDLVSALRIGEDLVYNQILSAILGIQEIRDLKQMTIEVYREGKKTANSSEANIDVSEDERLHPRAVDVTIEDGGTE